MKTAQQLFDREAQEKIRVAVSHAEADTSGEIRIHIENICKTDPYERAVKIFNEMGMGNTELRNAVLIYISVVNRKFCVIGDKGLDQRVPSGFWNEIASDIEEHFRNRKYSDGIVEAVRKIGDKLKMVFPALSGNKNELPDEINLR